MHILSIIFLLSVASSLTPQKLRVPIHRIKRENKRILSHSRIVLDQYKHKEQQVLRRHDLSHLLHEKNQFLTMPLGTDHMGFYLTMKVAGLEYNMSMDTGSSDVFIKGEDSEGSPEKRYKSGVDFKKTKQGVDLQYLDGALDTYVQNLDVQFQKYKFKAPLLVAYKTPPQFKQNQGLIGLSFPELANHRPTFIQTLIQNKIITKYAFGMNLNLIQPNRSFISFGEKDPSLYQGQLIQYPITAKRQIIIDFQWAQFGSGKKMLIPQAILDSGNTCISIPRNYQQQILKNFNSGKNYCYFNVEKNVKMFSLLICMIVDFDLLPLLSLSIGGNTYTIQKEYYIQSCYKVFIFFQPTSICSFYIQTVDYGMGKQIFLGDAFFNRFYAFFDIQARKIGIAKNKQNIQLQTILDLNANDDQFYFDTDLLFHSK